MASNKECIMHRDKLPVDGIAGDIFLNDSNNSIYIFNGEWKLMKSNPKERSDERPKLYRLVVDGLATNRVIEEINI